MVLWKDATAIVGGLPREGWFYDGWFIFVDPKQGPCKTKKYSELVVKEDK
jgi:hypothetical protein